jgi:HAD superfamily hydrolase (TIGR01450 family)
VIAPARRAPGPGYDAPLPSLVRVRDLLDRYDAVLLDAYGVLCDSLGALPGAASLVAELDRRHLPWAIITNDASRAPAKVAQRLTRFGVEVPPERVITSGALIAPHFAAHGLAGRRCVVLGTPDSAAYVEAGGGVIVAPDDDGAPIEAVVVCDDAIDPFLPLIEATITATVRALDAGVVPAMVLPNPDLVYPRGPGDWGVTAGTMAVMIEAAVHRLRPGAPGFAALGKPHAPMYAAARALVGDGRALAIGDQLDTDVAGALAAGLDAALVLGGVSPWRAGLSPTPTYLLASLE